jgi:hypothetical protein
MRWGEIGYWRRIDQLSLPTYNSTEQLDPTATFSRIRPRPTRCSTDSLSESIPNQKVNEGRDARPILTSKVDPEYLLCCRESDRQSGNDEKNNVPFPRRHHQHARINIYIYIYYVPL